MTEREPGAQRERAAATAAAALPVSTAVAADALDDRPLLLLLHGYGSNERDLPSIAQHLPERFQWASLRAPLQLPHGGFAWFPIETPGRPRAEVVRAAANGILDWIDAHVDPAVTIVPVGFSQGGLMVTQLLRRRHERFAAGVVLSGFVTGGEEPGDQALAAAGVPVFFGRGDVDGVIADEIFAVADAWLPEHTKLTRRIYPGLAHGISAEELADIAAFLDEAVPAAG